MGKRGPKPKGERAASAAERQAAYRARKAAGQPAARVVVKRPIDRRSRAQRWADAVEQLRELQAEYQEWLDALPESGGSEATREALEAITGLDLDELDVEPPRGFGRD